MSGHPVAPRTAAFAIRMLSDRFGAEIDGLDLREPLDPRTREDVLAALARYQVICFRDQSLDGKQQVAFSLQFGPLELFTIANRGTDNSLPLLNIVSNLGRDGKPTGKLETRRWHTDKSFLARPCFATILHPVILPPCGGETCFADMHAAYEALSPQEQATLGKLRVIHSREYSMRRAGKVPTPQEIEDAGPPMAHPLVRMNPFSGRKGLFMGEHASHIEGQEDSGRAPIDALEAHATQEQFVYRHAWRRGDVLMWDNGSLLHRGDDNFEVDMQARVLHRTCVSSMPAKSEAELVS